MNKQVKKELTDEIVQVFENLTKKYSLKDPILMTAIIHDSEDDPFIFTNHGSLKVAQMMFFNAFAGKDEVDWGEVGTA